MPYKSTRASFGTVNHSISFVNPQTGVHTQIVESYWNRVKSRFKRMKGVHLTQLLSYLDEFMWREWHGSNARMAHRNIMCDIAQQYPVWVLTNLFAYLRLRWSPLKWIMYLTSFGMQSSSVAWQTVVFLQSDKPFRFINWRSQPLLALKGKLVGPGECMGRDPSVSDLACWLSYHSLWHM